MSAIKNATMMSYFFQEQVEVFTTIFQSPFLPVQPSVTVIFKITSKYDKRYGPSHKKEYISKI